MKATQVKAPAEVLVMSPCCICGTKTIGYGRWKDSVTCSRRCESIKASQSNLLGENNGQSVP